MKSSIKGEKKNVLIVPSHLSQTDVSSIKGGSLMFSNMMFYFVNVPPSHSLESFHELVAENGGTFSMNLNNSVTHCVAADSKGFKFEAAKRRGDVIYYTWVLDCYAQKYSHQCKRTIKIKLWMLDPWLKLFLLKPVMHLFTPSKASACAVIKTELQDFIYFNFRKILLLVFECPHCGERNHEVQFAGETQPHGCCYSLEIPAGEQKMFNRQVLKSESATVKIPKLEFEIPPETQHGSLSTVEGILMRAVDELQALQEERRKVALETVDAID